MSVADPLLALEPARDRLERYADEISNRRNEKDEDYRDQRRYQRVLDRRNATSIVDQTESCPALAAVVFTKLGRRDYEAHFDLRCEAMRPANAQISLHRRLPDRRLPRILTRPLKLSVS